MSKKRPKIEYVPTLDEWVEENAEDLRSDIGCHIDNMLPATELELDDRDSLIRLIMISTRQWAQGKGL